MKDFIVLWYREERGGKRLKEIVLSDYELIIIAELCGMVVMILSLRKGISFVRSLSSSTESIDLHGIIQCRFVMQFFVLCSNMMNIVLSIAGIANLNINAAWMFEVREMFFFLCYGIPLIVIAIDEIVLVNGSLRLLWKSGFLLHVFSTIITIYVAMLMA